jgi:hypothetical protein
MCLAFFTTSHLAFTTSALIARDIAGVEFGSSSPVINNAGQLMPRSASSDGASALANAL